MRTIYESEIEEIALKLLRFDRAGVPIPIHFVVGTSRARPLTAGLPLSSLNAPVSRSYTRLDRRSQFTL